MNSNNIYNILNKFNSLTKETPAPVSQPKAKTKLEESIQQVSEKYMGFKKVEKAAKAGGAEDPAAVAASIGRKKYGKEKFQKAAAAGKKLGEAAKPDYIDLDKDGNKKESMKKAAKDAKASKKQVQEKAVSKAQQKFMGMVHAAQKGEKAASPEVAKVAKGMTKKAAHDYAATKHKGLPQHVKEAVQQLMSEGWTTDQIVEGWEDMMKDVEKRHKEKGTGKFDSHKTDKGTKYTRKYNPKTGETDDTENVTAVKRGRGRPKKSQFESATLANKMIKESFANFIEGSIQGGVWTANPPKKGQPNVPVPQDIDGASVKPAPVAPKTAPAASAPKTSAPALGTIKGGVWTSDPPKAGEKGVPVPVPVDEDDMEEGNAFSGAVAKAKADGIQKGEKITVGGKEYPVKEEAEDDLEESLNQMRRIAGLPVVEAKKADKDYDGDGKVESGKDEYLGSKIAAAKKAGKLKESTCKSCHEDPCVCKEDKCMECGMWESKCSCSKEKVDECMSPIAGAAQDMQDSQGKMSINTSMDSDGHKTVTINADGDAAGDLMQMLKLAGLGGGSEEHSDEHMHQEPEGVAVVVSGEDEGEMGGEDEEEVAEEKDSRYHASTTPDEHVMPTQTLTKGGNGDVAGEEKKMTKHGYQFGDNPQAMKESLKLMKEYEAIKVKKKTDVIVKEDQMDEVSLGDYYSKAHKAKITAAAKMMFADPAKPETQKAMRDFRNRDTGMKRVSARNQKAQKAQAEKQRQDSLAADKDNIEQLKAALVKLQAGFDPNYEYSDDHSFWSSQRDLAQRIRSLKQRIAAAEQV